MASLTCLASNGSGSPRYKQVYPVQMERQNFGLDRTPAYPTAKTIRPQFGSPPVTAVLTRLLMATDRQYNRRRHRLVAPLRRSQMRCVAPSQSRGSFSPVRWLARSARRQRPWHLARQLGLQSRRLMSQHHQRIIGTHVPFDTDAIEGFIGQRAEAFVALASPRAAHRSPSRPASWPCADRSFRLLWPSRPCDLLS